MIVPAKVCNCHYFSATDKHGSGEHTCPVNSNYRLKVKTFNLCPFTKQHRSVRSFTDYRAKSNLSPDGVRHAVRPQGPHHAQSLQRGFALPFLWEFLFFRTLGLHKLLPAFGRAFNVSVQVPELFHGTQGLVGGGEKNDSYR